MKDKFTFKYAIVLGVISIVSAVLISLSYNMTKDGIEAVEKDNFLQGLHRVLPAFDNDPESDSVNIDGKKVYIGEKDGNIVGYAVESSSGRGYGGEVKLLIGVKPDGSIYNVAIIKHSETPGLGDKIALNSFTDKFKNISIKSKVAVKSDGGNIDQFSGATMSPRAVCDALNIAFPILSDAIRSKGNE